MINTIKTIDKTVLLRISKLHRPVLDKIMVAFTFAGSAGAIWGIIAISMLFATSNRDKGIRLMLSLLLTGFMGEIIIKRLVGRIRPSKTIEQEEMLIRKPSTYSFPSGHTSSSFAAALTLSFSYDSHIIAISAFILAACIAFSRLYLRVHYLSDVVAGAVLGIICAVIVNFFYLA